MTFYHAAYFSRGTRASGAQDAWKPWELKGAEGHELPQAFPRPARTVSDLQCGLESRRFAVEAEWYGAKQHFQGVDSQDLRLKQEPLQSDGTDAPALIYSPLGMLSRCFIRPRHFVPRCRQDINLKIRAAGGRPLPDEPCGNLPQAELVAGSLL